MPSSSVRSNAANIQLPSEIKCKTCLKFKKEGHYSKTSINDLKSAISRYGRSDRILHNTSECVACKSAKGPQTEVQCARCDRWRTRSHFSANALKRGDDAMCWDCQKDVDSMEPLPVDDDDDDYNTDSSDSQSSDGYESDEAVSSLAQTMRATSVAGSSIAGGVGLPTASAGKPNTSNWKAFSVASGGTVASSGTVASGCTAAPSSQSPRRPASVAAQQQSSQWVRIRAAPKPAETRAKNKHNDIDEVEVESD